MPSIGSRQGAPLWRTLILGACAVILVLRLPDRFTNPQFFAEDAVFYIHAMKWGWRSMAFPYGGYLLVAPRLAANLGLLLSPRWVPLWFNLCSLGLALWVLRLILSDRNPLPAKAGLALLLVLFPHLEDIFLVLENCQWILSLGLVVVLISQDPATRLQWIGDSVFVVLSGLTGVFSALFCPLFCVRAVQRKTPASAVLAVLTVAGGLLQAHFIVRDHHPPPTTTFPFDPAVISSATGFHLFGHLFAGESAPAFSLVTYGFVGCAVVALLGWFIANPDVSPAERTARRYLTAVLVIQLAASAYRFHDQLPVYLTVIHLERYFFVPDVVIIWLALSEARTSGIRRTVGTVLAGAYAVGAMLLFRQPPLVDLHWPAFAAQIEQGKLVDVPINPPDWHFIFNAPAAPNDWGP